MEYIMSALGYLSDSFNEILEFIQSIPNLIMDAFSYGWYWAIKIYLTIKLWSIETAYEVASMLLHDYEVYQVLNVMFNQLPDDLKYACHAFGVVDGIRIVIDAMATAFVLRIMGW